MKRLFTLISAALLVAGSAEAQQQSRLVRVSNKTDNGQGMMYVDSSHVIYRDNSRGMDGTDYQYAQYMNNNTTTCDTIAGFAYYQGNWQTGMHYQMSYDAQGRISVMHLLMPSGVGTGLVSYIKTTFTYDAAGNIIKTLREMWKASSSTWENQTQTTFIFTNGNLVKEERQQWYNNAWANDQLAEYTYSNGLKTEYYYTGWNYMTGALYSKNKTTYSYNSSGHNTQVLTQEYDNGSSTYKDKYREVHTVDANGNVTQTLSENWNNNAWESYSKLRYTYNSKGLQTLDTFETWDAPNSVYKPSLTYEYTYDDSGNNIDFIVQLWNTDSVIYIKDQRLRNDWNTFNQVTRYHTYRWNKTTNVWEQVTGDDDNMYYYELYTPTVGINDMNSLAADVKLYPVPARDYVTLDIKWETAQDFTVSITDLQGRPVRLWKEDAAATYHKQIPVSTLATGNYFITISDGAHSFTKQFMVVNR